MFDAFGKQTAKGRQAIEHETAQQQWTTPITVRQRPIEQHAQARPGEEGTDHVLHLGCAARQVSGDLRQAGQLGIDGKRHKGRQ
ncbi:hypothetical protein ASC74_15515 [Pseudomonas sp. Root329]|nr:hypothetical protein ASC74_15515 [Pseudomonas sp. Root329]